MNKVLDGLRKLDRTTPILFAFPSGETITVPLGDVLDSMAQSPAFNPVPAFPRPVTVTDALNIRSGPGSSNRVVATLKTRAIVVVSEQSGDWLRLADGRGWINAGYVK